MNIFKLLFVIINLVFINLNYGQHSNLEKITKTGKVIIFISSESKIDIDTQPFRVFLERNGILQEMLYQNNQTFELNAQHGVYNIILKDNFGEVLRYQRASFYVSDGKTTTLPINILESGNQVCVKNFGVALLPDDYGNSHYRSPKYDNITVLPHFNLVIKYCKKNLTPQKLLTYTFATVTYKNITFQSDKIVFDRKKMIFEVKGKKKLIWFQIGNCKKQSRKFRLHLNDIAKVKCF